MRDDVPPGETTMTQASTSDARGAGGPALAPVEPSPLAIRDRTRYRIEGEHGRGGLGRVLRATDRELQRTVAVKELLERTPMAEARFVREATLTAGLEHPSIVPVHEAGRWADGTPYYAMKLIDGRPLRELIREATDVPARLALLPHVVAVADAIAYAHDRGIIHRDLKPGNVIVGRFGETVVIDWGLAKRLGSIDAAETDAGASRSVDAGLTAAGDVLGTPAYMAPEQARGEPVDTRSDIYAVGALLYGVLAGRPPYEGPSDVVLAAVREREPPALAVVAPAVPPELRAIAARAMARAPEDRYPSAEALATDLRRYQTGKLVGAHTYRASDLVRRWMRRHRAAVLAGFGLLAAIGVVTLISIARIVRERDAADDARGRAEVQQHAAERAQALAIERQHDLLISNARGALDRDPTATLAWLAQVPVDARTRVQVRRLAADAVARRVARHILAGHSRTVRGLAFVSDTALATGDEDGNIRVWDLATGKGRLLGTHRTFLNGFVGAPDGRVCGFDRLGYARLWDPGGRPPQELDRVERIWAVAVDPQRARIAVADATPRISLWTPSTGAIEVIATARTRVEQMAFAPRGPWLAVSSDDSVRLLDLEHGGERQLGHDGAETVLFSPDGAWLVTAGLGTPLRMWNAATGQPRPLVGHTGDVFIAAFTPDGRFLVTAGEDRSVRVWDVAGGTARVWNGHQGSIPSLAISPDGRWVATGDDTGEVRLWDLATGEDAQLRGHRNAVIDLKFSPDGTWLASGSADKTVRVWAVAQQSHRALVGHKASVDDVAFTPDRRALVSLSSSGLRRWDLASGAGEALGQPPGQTPGGVAIASDSRTMYLANGPLWRALPGAPLAMVAPPEAKAFNVRVARDDRVVVASEDGSVSLLAPHGLQRLFDNGDWVTDLAPLPDGRILTGATDGKIRLWAPGDGAPAELGSHGKWVFAVGASPDGALGWSFAQDNTVKLWGLDGRTPATPELRGHTDLVLSARLSPDGTRMVTASRDGTGRIWTLATGAWIALPHDDAVFAADFSPDGTIVFTGSGDGTVRLWSSDGTLRAIHRAGGGAIDAEVSADGTRLAVGSVDGVIRVWPFPGDLLPTDDTIPAMIAHLTTAVVGPLDDVATPP